MSGGQRCELEKKASVHRAIAGCKHKHDTFSERSSPDMNPLYPGKMDLGRDTTHTHKFKATRGLKSTCATTGILISQLCPSADFSACADLKSAGLGAELLQNTKLYPCVFCFEVKKQPTNQINKQTKPQNMLTSASPFC